MRAFLPAVLTILTFSSVSVAEESAQVSTSTAQTVRTSPPPRRQSSGIRLHDGFYFRVGGGFGAYQERIFKKMGSDEAHTTVTGMGTAGEITMGGSVSRRVVLGGGLWSMTALATDVTTTAGPATATPVPAGAAGSPSLSILGPFLAYYPDPAEGFALHFALGFAASREADPGDGRFDRDRAAVGGGGLFGIGYEWWVGEQWSMGVAWRIAAAVASGKQDGQRLTHLIGTAPVGLFTVTYH